MNDAEKLRKITEERRAIDRAAVTETLEDLYQNIFFPKAQTVAKQGTGSLYFIFSFDEIFPIWINDEVEIIKRFFQSKGYSIKGNYSSRQFEARVSWDLPKEVVIND